MAFTLGQLALFAIVVVVLVGVPISVIPFVRRGPKDDLARPLELLHWGFWATIPTFALAMTLENFFPSGEPRNLLLELVANLLLAAFYGFAWLYWTALATLASRTGRSAPLWVAAGLATLAIGFVVSYVLMGNDVRAAIKTKQA